MQINITRFFNEANAFEFSRSEAEAGKNAGPDSWRNAMQEAERAPLLTTPEELEALRLYVKDFGAWSPEEIAAWSPVEVNALFVQLVSGDIREAGLDSDPDAEDWEEYESRSQGGQCSGNIWKNDAGEIFYSLDR